MLMRIENIDKRYGKQQVLEQVSFDIKAGEILGLVGESGCGKSTLARIIGGYEAPSTGAVFFENYNLQKMRGKDLKAFRRSCQMIFQDNLASLDPSMKLMTALKEPLNNNFSMGTEEKESRIRRLMNRMKLKENILPKFPANISGGERQRANICRALLVGPKLMICDEITSSLDVITQQKLLVLLKELNENGMTILFISHDIDAVKSISDRVMVMHDGRMIEMLKREEDFLGTHPYTKKLFEALPIRHPSQRKQLEAEWIA